MPGITVTEAAEAIDRAWQKDGIFTEQTRDRFKCLLDRFAHYCTARGGLEFEGVDERVACAFVRAKGRRRDGSLVDPAPATMQLRRAVLRAAFRTARALALTYEDPLRDLVLPQRERGVTRPLTRTEADLLWLHAWDEGRATRHATTIALLLAGANTGEIGYITVADVDQEGGRVWAHGSHKHRARWIDLAPRGMQAVQRRSTALLGRDASASPETCILATGSDGDSAHRQARVCVTVRDVLVRAGLGDDPRIRPASVSAFAGARVFEHTGRVEDAAAVLGLRSLDATARAIGYAWCSEG